MSEIGKVTVIDSQIAGIAGDMVLGALIDLGADCEKVVSAIKSLEEKTYGYQNVKVTTGKVTRKGFSATLIDVTAKGSLKKDGKELVEIVKKSTKNLKLSKKAQQFALNTIHTLVEAEAKIHKNDLADAHLHEVGLIDTPAEIVGIAVALDDLGLFDSRIYATPVSVGGGLFRFSHGTVSSPAPATLDILQSKNFPLSGGPVEAELATPTGVAILVSLADEICAFYPEMVPLKTGYGAGKRDFKEVPNIIRIILGKAAERVFTRDEIAVLETNLDDVTGELVGNVVDCLMKAGAKDVSVIPMFTKKNRPGQIIKVIADKQDVERFTQILVEETGTLGVRVYPCERFIMNRESIILEMVINGAKQKVRVKVSKNSEGEVIRVKPEFEDAKRLADKTSKSVREIMEIIMTRARDVLTKR